LEPTPPTPQAPQAPPAGSDPPQAEGRRKRRKASQPADKTKSGSDDTNAHNEGRPGGKARHPLLTMEPAAVAAHIERTRSSLLVTGQLRSHTKPFYRDDWTKKFVQAAQEAGGPAGSSLVIFTDDPALYVTQVRALL
jgi:hypothetical protein